MKTCLAIHCASVVAVAVGFSNLARAQDNSADLAKKLSNPIASLISVPFQFNYDEGFGPSDGEKVTLNIQPVIPISLSENWNVISRTILPVIWQNDIAGDSGEQTGLGDITQSLFLSPKNPGPSGIVWGAGPAFLVPTGTDEPARHRQMGRGSDRRGAETDRRLDRRRAGKPHLVLRWRRRPRRCQLDLSAAFHLLHDA